MIKPLIFLIFFLLTISKVSALELNVSYSGNKTVITLIDCPESGLGSYYIVFSYDPPNAKILNVSTRFISDYNIVNNTILIAGIQGEIPGPSGNIELVKIVSNKEIKINLILVDIKDVNGRLIYHYSSKTESSQKSAPAQTPVPTSTPTSTPQLSTPVLSPVTTVRTKNTTKTVKESPKTPTTPLISDNHSEQTQFMPPQTKTQTKQSVNEENEQPVKEENEDSHLRNEMIIAAGLLTLLVVILLLIWRKP